ncbi:hypothetical protein KGF56_001977 [Candida oxycetoniae]|uniref:Vacuolar protein sorting-associated protein 75 n=1 Tax=Candida oxycetoniae TaxID=497107 RepID=A0AAI9SY17_9ASCO|nr:uncharacterized protein KGF56_001977 [Candida oxycetoniae]KAI3405232.1 hypothetical protein KGF56_001977 [Candida oxycetoniae]
MTLKKGEKEGEKVEEMSHELSAEQEDESIKLRSSLDKLSSWENEMSQVDRDVEIYRIKSSQPMYTKRREILQQVPKFWYIILAENDEFADYISPEDLKYLEYINDIYVHYPIAEAKREQGDAAIAEAKREQGDAAIAEAKREQANALANYKDFEVTISFADCSFMQKQSITKKFRTIVGEDGEEHLKSEYVSVQWPKELAKFNPQLIKEKTKSSGSNMSAKEKKNYRIGMKSFFAWFAWTGEKPGKEFRHGEDLTQLIVEDIFINALKYYIVALSNESGEEEDEEEEEDSSEGEELDLSDIEEEERKRPLEDQNNENNKKKKVDPL